MTNVNIREAHRIIKNAGSVMTRDQIDLLRSVLPPLPKQKTLEGVTDHVYDAWVGTNGDEWPDDVHGGLETWLSELHTQLQGLKDTPATVLALPAGIRLADHEGYGRVVVSPKPDQDDVYILLVPRPRAERGADWEYAHEAELTFIDAEPAKSAHPEFLETEADYENAPEGTVVAWDGSRPWYKCAEPFLSRFDSKWTCESVYGKEDAKGMSCVRRRVLRWGANE